MAWEMLAKPYYSDSDLTDTTVKQAVIWPDYNPILKAVKASLIFYNDPTFTSLVMKIYSESLVLLHTSSARAKADIVEGLYDKKDVYFEFANVNLTKDTTYYFVVNASGYSSASTSKHIAWKNAYPDNFFPTSADTKVEGGIYPLEIYTIDARFDQP